MRRKRTITVLLAILMVAGLLTPLALAQEPANMEALSVRHTFTDVHADTWYDDAVQFVFQNNVMQGIGNNQFSPDGTFTIAQVIATIFRVEHGRAANQSDSIENTFHDVAGQWFAAYATWAQAKGIVTGNAFRGDDNAQRQEIALFIYRYAVKLADMDDHSRQSAQWAQFTDRGNIASWAHDALRWMNYHGIVTGTTTTTISPTGNATRAQAAMMMMRTMAVMGIGNHVIPERPAPPVVTSHTFTLAFSTFEQPDVNSRRISRFNPQTVNVVESQCDGWALISTYRGEYWAFLHGEDMPHSDAQINLDRNHITASGPGVTIRDNVATIYAGGRYFISGILDDGQIRVTAPAGAEVRLILHEVSITNPRGAAIYTDNPTTLQIHTSTNTWNALINSNPSTVRQQAAVYTRGYTTLSGEGILTVLSANNRGIASRSNLTFTSGSIVVNSQESAIFAGRHINVYGGRLTAQTSGRAGIGFRSDHAINIHGGNININAAYEGMEAAFVNIRGGYIHIYSADDGINIFYSRGLLTIFGGEIFIDARGDGVDSNNAFAMRGGRLFISAEGRCPMSQAIDVEGHNNFRLYGGTIVGTSPFLSNMPRGHAAQPSLYVEFRNRFSAGVEISLFSSSNERIVEFTAMRPFTHVLITSPELVLGERYLLYLDGSRVLEARLNQAITRITR